MNDLIQPLLRGRGLAVTLGVVFVLVGVVGYLQGSGRLNGQLEALAEKRSTYINVMNTVRSQRDALPESRGRERALIERTLGPDVESVDSRIRQRLFSLAQSSGLGRISVSTQGVTARRTPARSEFRRSGDEKILRDEIDFVELSASLSGRGTYPKIIDLMARIHSDGWLKRVTETTLNPDPNGELFDVVVRVTTIFVPERAHDEDIVEGAYGDSRLSTILASNPFALPVPPAVEIVIDPRPVEPVKSTLPAPGFPYRQWMLTGAVVGPDGPEAWVRNTKTNERRSLTAGDLLGKASFVDVQGDNAVFTIESRSFTVRIGRSLDIRAKSSR
jgi:hypothetical protein